MQVIDYLCVYKALLSCLNATNAWPGGYIWAHAARAARVRDIRKRHALEIKRAPVAGCAAGYYRFDQVEKLYLDSAIL